MRAKDLTWNQACFMHRWFMTAMCPGQMHTQSREKLRNSMRWMLATWGKLTMDEVIIQLSTGIIGTGGGMIQKYLLGALLPCLLIMALICILLRKNRGKESYGIIQRRSFLASFAAFVILLVITCVRLDAVSFIRSQTVGSTFIEDNYVDPDKTSITFPEKKRNLIYIVLESIEVTYADEENGGAFSNNVIDELTQLSEENPGPWAAYLPRPRAFPSRSPWTTTS